MTARSFAASQKEANASSHVVSVDPGKGPSQFAGANIKNRGSNAFVFNNSDIAREKGRPNAASAETLGEVYAGRIGGGN
jgi:hypothetical protein